MSFNSTDVKTPGIVAIAKKWKLPVAKVMELVNQGAEVEKEHNKSIVKARQVARDHINERPDYYKKLKKMEKTPISVKEETGVSGVRGLGYVTGDPGVDPVQSYIDTNSMSYDDLNGNILQLIRDKHSKLHKNMGFAEYTPNDIQNNLKEAYAKKKLNELGGNMGYEGLTDAAPRARRDIQIAEGPKLDKAKKIAMAGMTAANMYTMADVAGRATEGGHGSPRGDVVRAASAMPGAVGWGATVLHYGNKGYKLARQALKSKKDKMEEESIKEDLRKWFREKWVRYDTKGNIKGPCAREEGEGKPKCRPLASARAMSKTERAKSARRKRREDPVADRQGKGGKPINVQTEETLLEKNVPTNPALWARAKAQAKAKFDVYPSAYANGWASKWYKSKGGGWKSAANESVDEACWDTHKQVGWKKKGKRMVPDCVPKEEVEIDEAAVDSKGYKSSTGGLTQKGRDYYNSKTGGNLQAPVTTKPSKLKPGSKAANRRKSFCARMGGMKGPMKDEKGRPTRKALALRKWNCEEETQMKESATMAALAAGSALGAAAAPHINKAVGKGLDWLEKKRKQKHQDHYEKKSRKDVKEENKYPNTAERSIYEDGFDVDAVSHAIRDKESGTSGGYNAKSKSSSASGAYQYINKTWKGSASKYGVDTKQFPTARSAPKEVQDKVFMNDLQKNANKYGGLEKAVNVHYTGNPGGKVSAAGLKANRGQTGGGYMDDIKKRVDDYNTERKSTMGAAQQMAANFSGGSKSLSTPDSTQFAKAPEAPKPTQVASAPETPKMQNPDQNITKVASASTPTQVSQLDTKDKKQISEISDTLVGAANNATFWKGRTPSKRLERYVRRAQLRDPEEIKKKEKTKKKTVKEETKMENQNLINEALENILENNLNEMKENLLEAINEKAIEKLEERKKAIAADYFAQ